MTKGEAARELKIHDLEYVVHKLNNKIAQFEAQLHMEKYERERLSAQCYNYFHLVDAARLLTTSLRQRGDIANIAVFGLEIIEKIEAVEGLV